MQTQGSSVKASTRFIAVADELASAILITPRADQRVSSHALTGRHVDEPRGAGNGLENIARSH
jgi:hypothetical protein